MPEGPFGVDRPLADFRPFGPIFRKEPDLISELKKAIGDEESARTEYQTLIELLEENGYDDKAEIVRGIQQDEIEHRKTFKDIKEDIE